jgi:hypothetical protein
VATTMSNSLRDRRWKSGPRVPVVECFTFRSAAQPAHGEKNAEKNA